MLWQVEAVCARLDDFDPAPPVLPVLCFVHGEWPLLNPPGAYAGVRLEGTRSIRRLVTSDGFLGAVAIDQIHRELAAALPAKTAASDR